MPLVKDSFSNCNAFTFFYCSGLPVRNEDRHAVEVTNCAMDLLSYVTQFKVPHIDNYELRIRIGKDL